MVERKAQALQAAAGWRRRSETIQTDGSRICDGKVGTAAMWWEEAHTQPPWTEPGTGATFHPVCRVAGQSGRQHNLGRNKEVYDTELYARRSVLQVACAGICFEALAALRFL